MATLARPCSHVQVCFTFLHGPVIRIDGKSSPTTLDAIEQTYGAAALDSMMESPGHFITVAGMPPEWEQIPVLQPLASVCNRPNPAVWPVLNPEPPRAA